MRIVRAALGRGALLAVLWWVLTEGDSSTWTYGAVIVPLVTLSTFFLLPLRTAPLRVVRRALPAVRLTGWFLWRSVLGGVDVAARSLRSPVDTDPVIVEHRLVLPTTGARVLCANLSSLMPGALSVDLHDDVLVMHVLHREMPATAQLDDLQRRIMAVLEA